MENQLTICHTDAFHVQHLLQTVINSIVVGAEAESTIKKTVQVELKLTKVTFKDERKTESYYTLGTLELKNIARIANAVQVTI